MVSLRRGRGRRLVVGIISIIAIALAFAFTTLLLHTPSTKTPSRFELQTRYAVNDSLYSYPNASLIPRQDRTCDWDTIAQTTGQEPYEALTYCEKKYVQGSWLQCMLNDDSIHVDQYGWASSWTDTQSMSDWGWRTSITQRVTLNNKGFEAPFITGPDALGLNLGGWNNLVQKHELSSQHGGITYPATNGGYFNYFNSKFNAIVASSNWSPDYTNSERPPARQIPANRITKLKSWSDLVFLGLKQYGQQNGLPSYFMQNMAHVFRHHIINDETQDILKMVFGISDVSQIPAWPGYTVNWNHPEFKVMLASPNARGVAFLLGQHKAFFGQKVITHIRVFKCKDGYQANLVCMYLRLSSTTISPLLIREIEDLVLADGSPV